MKSCEIDGQLMLFVLEPSGKTTVKPPKQKASTSALVSIPYFHLDLSKDHVDIFGCHYWELRSPWREDGPPLNTGVAPRNPVRCSLSEILEPAPHRKYYLSKDACLGILRRARERGKELPPQLREALMAQAGLKTWTSHQLADPVAFAANQRDEVRDLHDVAGALGAQPGMKQQTFIAENCLNPWDTQQARVFTAAGKAPTLAGADGGGGRNPAGLLFAAGFCAGASPAAGNIGYQEEISPTLRGSPSGNMMPLSSVSTTRAAALWTAPRISPAPCGRRSMGTNQF